MIPTNFDPGSAALRRQIAISRAGRGRAAELTSSLQRWLRHRDCRYIRHALRVEVDHGTDQSHHRNCRAPRPFRRRYRSDHPASWLKRVERTGFGIGLFSAWRENDPDFVLNRPEYAGASILVAGPNFGIGSSREHAVWALTDYGSAPSSHLDSAISSATMPRRPACCQSSSPRSSAKHMMRAVDADPGLSSRLTWPRGGSRLPVLVSTATFPLDGFTRHRLLEGLDDIGISLQHADKITAFEARRPDWMPRVLQG
jgi:3-isopropylmalate/(R)-2-methylmalate dehydratase small subunit